MAQISKATVYNWKKLNSSVKEKLMSRANKTQSTKKVIATNFLDFQPANLLFQRLLQIDEKIENIMYTLCVSLLKYCGIHHQRNVQVFLSQYQQYQLIDIDIPKNVWKEEKDVLGFIYQSLTTEGERNILGRYYTNKKIADYMLRNKHLKDKETFLDPCCGSGTFLLSVKTHTPECLYGFDIDPVAVMITATNLLRKYKKNNFIPHVYCLDFLRNNLFDNTAIKVPSKFDNIYTNPPWGADKDGAHTKEYPELKSKERSSMFVVEALKRLLPNGSLYFLLPTSLLKIKTHADIRKYILSNATIKNIDIYAERFDGVYTDYFSIKLHAKKCTKQKYTVLSNNKLQSIELSKTEIKAGNIVTEPLSLVDAAIIKKMELKRYTDLTHSQWALGIVTGNNKEMVKTQKIVGAEPVYTGKQITPFNLKDTSSYLLFKPKEFQQCAKEQYYRASEKLIYKFIAKYPIVAYDNKQCLCLNSANILIPKLEGISIKSVAALLNSSLYRFYYRIKFSDIKVLKSNLQALPFPYLSAEQDERLCSIVSDIQTFGYNNNYQAVIDEFVFSLFEITSAEQMQINLKIGY